MLFAAVAWFLYCTRSGLKLRAIGENPHVEHALGFAVVKTRWGATLFGGVMAGLAGAYYAVIYLRPWQEQRQQASAGSQSVWWCSPRGARGASGSGRCCSAA